MTPYEKETHIQWNDEEDFITIFTCHRRIITKMTKLKAKLIDKVVIKGKEQGRYYRIPKKDVNIGIYAKRSMSAKQKDEMKKRMRDNIQGKKVT